MIVNDDTITAPLVVSKVWRLRKKFQWNIDKLFRRSGYEAAVEKNRMPVMDAGLASSSYIMAQIFGYKFSVITIGGKKSIKAIEKRIISYGLEDNLSSIYNIDIHVIDIKKRTEFVIDRFVELALRAYKEDGAGTIIMGCTGLSPLIHRISHKLSQIKVIDPTLAGFLLLKSLCIYLIIFMFHPMMTCISEYLRKHLLYDL